MRVLSADGKWRARQSSEDFEGAPSRKWTDKHLGRNGIDPSSAVCRQPRDGHLVVAGQASYMARLVSKRPSDESVQPCLGKLLGPQTVLISGTDKEGMVQ